MNVGNQFSKLDSPSAAFMAGWNAPAHYSDEEVAERIAEMELLEQIDAGYLSPEPLSAPDIDEGDQPEPESLNNTGRWF